MFVEDSVIAPHCLVRGISVNTRLVVPGQFKIEIGGLDPDHKFVANWRWVKFGDLITALHHLVSSGVGPQSLPLMSEPSQLFDRFGLLSGQCGGEEMLSWVCGDSCAIDSRIRPDNKGREILYLPSGFSQSVISLVSLGVVRVSARIVPTGVYTGEVQLSSHCLVGYMQGGEERLIVSRGRHGPFELLPES